MTLPPYFNEWFQYFLVTLLPALREWFQTLLLGKLTLFEYAPLFVACVGAHASVMRYWETELPALLTLTVARSEKLSRVFKLCSRNRKLVLEHDDWNRKTWMIWLNSEYCYNSECKKMIAHLLSCPVCFSFHVGYAVAGIAWFMSRFTVQPMALLSVVAFTLALPSFSLWMIKK